MSSATPTLELAFPEITYGSVWIVSSGDGEPDHLSPLAVYALITADAVIHDPGIASGILDLVKPPRYREAATPGRAVERLVKLAQDGWWVVHLVDGNVMKRVIECTTRFAEHDIPFRIAPNNGEPGIGQAPIGLLLVCKPLAVTGTKAGKPVVLIATAQSRAATVPERRQAPLSFSMSGLAGQPPEGNMNTLTAGALGRSSAHWVWYANQFPVSADLNVGLSRPL